VAGGLMIFDSHL